MKAGLPARRPIRLTSNRDSFLIFCSGIVVFTVGLSPEFLGLDCRFAMFAQEMLRNGPTFFPTTYGQPYPDYPSTSTWLIYLASLPFGKVTHFSAVLPVAVISALILVVTYRIGAMHSRQWGLCAVAVTLFTIEFVELSRSSSPDQYVGLATALCFYLAYSAEIYDRPKRLWFTSLVFAAGFAFRGPLGLVIPAGVQCGYYLYGKDVRKLLVTAGSALIVFVLCSIALLAAAHYQGGDSFMKTVIHAQATGRIRGEGHGFLYYWYQSFAGYAVAYPLAVVVTAFRFREILRRQDLDHKFLGYLILWVAVVIFGLSIPGAKKIRYIVPMVPAVALVAAYIFISPSKNDFLAIIKRIFLNACLWLPVSALVVVAVLWFISRQLGTNLNACCPQTLLLMLVLAIYGRWLSVRLRKNMVSYEIDVMFIGVAVFIGIIVGIVEPINYSRNRTSPFVQMVASLQRSEACEIVFYKINPDGDAVKFMVNWDKPIEPQFIRSADAVLNRKDPAYFIALKKDFDALPPDRVHVLGYGKIGHVDCIVFNTK